MNEQKYKSLCVTFMPDKPDNSLENTVFQNEIQKKFKNLSCLTVKELYSVIANLPLPPCANSFVSKFLEQIVPLFHGIEK